MSSPTAALACPRCKGELRPAVVDDAVDRVAASSCAGCGGWLIARDELAKVADTPTLRFVEIPRFGVSRRQQRLPLVCTGCRVEMEKERHPRDARVLLDVCPRCHAVWLDRGELEAIQQESLARFVLGTVRWLIDQLQETDQDEAAGSARAGS